HCVRNGPIGCVCLPGFEDPAAFIEAMKADGGGAVFHYDPLHSSPAGRRFGRTSGRLAVTDDVSARLVRLPLYAGLADDLDQVLAIAGKAIEVAVEGGRASVPAG